MEDDCRVRGLVQETDLTPDRLKELLALARHLKSARLRLAEQPLLAGKTIALLFAKSSTRTRSAFEVAALGQGAQVSYFGPGTSHLGVHESAVDTAMVLGRMYDGIAYRGPDHHTVERLARHSGVPVWNALTPPWHPTQALADMLTIKEHCAKPWADICLTYVGDGRSNVANSLRIAGALLGMTVRVVAPASMSGSPEMRDQVERICARTGGGAQESDDIDEGVRDADFVYADTWIHLGEPVESWRPRVAALAPYRIDHQVLAATKNPQVRFLHCMPAVHDTSTSIGAAVLAETGREGAEVTTDVFRGPASLVLDQAENRMHAIKALLVSDLAAQPHTT
ncbi:ornithine carbamoyltransferase [Streptomyces sp. NRRL S-920]|uniref:ornithine carbamoyltransferase n=1 Tax=Streptomyces sp. NRRL S-920 TaxID=1463921 RepID=UPI0004C67355|nr:ornithine carbamoyltransferase [Streptomyces sp. NRRL S-920]